MTEHVPLEFMVSRRRLRMTYDQKKIVVERGHKIEAVIARKLALERAKEALRCAGVPEQFWR